MSGTSAITALIYAGTAQSLKSLARELLAHGTFTKKLSFALRSCRLAAI